MKPDAPPQEVLHSVRIPYTFAILDREISRFETDAFAPADLRPTRPIADYQLPSTALGWYESVNFCRWLTTLCGKSESEQAYPHSESLLNQGYETDPNWRNFHSPRFWPVDITKPGIRLPLEVEWEAAARAGTSASYFWGTDLNLLQYYANSVGPRILPVKSLRPNVSGLFDVSGNVAEMCHDWFDQYVLGLKYSAPAGSTTHSDEKGRVFRGGGFNSPIAFFRTAWRGTMPPAAAVNPGFRPVMTLSP